GPTPVDDATRECREIADRVRTNRMAYANVQAVLAALLAMKGHTDEATELGGRSKALLEELNVPVRLGHIRSLLADAELRAGRSEQAERELRQAYAELARVGDRAGSITVALELADVLLDRSQDAGAAEWLAKSQDVLERSDVMTRVLGEGVRARLLARAGAASEADVLAKHAVELAES